MQKSSFATKTFFVPRTIPSVSGVNLIADDLGFSSPKVIGPFGYGVYQNSAKKADSDAAIGTPLPSDIMLRNKSGYWHIGAQAADLMADSRSINYEEDLYGRNRYFSPTFNAILEASLAIALKKNGLGCPDTDNRIVLQTGLPPRYRSADTEVLRQAFARDYEFDIRIGNTPYEHFRFHIDHEDIHVMDQPMGSLISAVTDQKGNIIRDQVSLLREKTLVFDGGFRTLDVYNISSGTIVGEPQTYDNLGMLEVFRRAISYIKDSLGTVVTIAQLQTAIDRGYINAGDWRLGKTRQVPVNDILQSASSSVCKDAIDKIMMTFDGLQDHQNLVITGGTGTLWHSRIQEYLKGRAPVRIICANRNDTGMSNIFSNVRGYYFYRLNRLRKELR